MICMYIYLYDGRLLMSIRDYFLHVMTVFPHERFANVAYLHEPVL